MSKRTYETIQQTAERLGISTKTVRREVSRGNFTAYRIGSAIRLDPRQVDAALRPIPAGGGPRDAA